MPSLSRIDDDACVFVSAPRRCDRSPQSPLSVLRLPSAALVMAAGFAIGVGLNESRNNPTTVSSANYNAEQCSTTKRRDMFDSSRADWRPASGQRPHLPSDAHLICSVLSACVCDAQSEEVWTAHIKEVEREKRRVAREAAAAAAAASSSSSSEPHSAHRR